jgi:hypothetical protein
VGERPARAADRARRGSRQKGSGRGVQLHLVHQLRQQGVAGRRGVGRGVVGDHPADLQYTCGGGLGHEGRQDVGRAGRRVVRAAAVRERRCGGGRGGGGGRCGGQKVTHRQQDQQQQGTRRKPGGHPAALHRISGPRRPNGCIYRSVGADIGANWRESHGHRSLYAFKPGHELDSNSNTLTAYRRAHLAPRASGRKSAERLHTLSTRPPSHGQVLEDTLTQRVAEDTLTQLVGGLLDALDDVLKRSDARRCRVPNLVLARRPHSPSPTISAWSFQPTLSFVCLYIYGLARAMRLATTRAAMVWRVCAWHAAVLITPRVVLTY